MTSGAARRGVLIHFRAAKLALLCLSDVHIGARLGGVGVAPSALALLAFCYPALLALACRTCTYLVTHLRTYTCT